MPRYSISNVPTEVIGLYAGSGVFRGRLGDIINNGGKAGSPSSCPLAEPGERKEGAPVRSTILAWISVDKPQSEGGVERHRC